MRHCTLWTSGFPLLAALTCAACAGSEPPPPASPPPAAEPAAAPPPTAEAEAPSDASSDDDGGEAEASDTPAPPAAAPEPEPEPAPSEPTTPRTELLTESDVAFMLDYPNSGPKQAAETKCAGDDPKARAECMQKARDEFLSDVLTFRKSGSGAVTFTIYHRHGSQLQEIYTVGAELADKSPTEVSLTVKGKGKGTRPLFATQRSTTITMPDDYTVTLDDPRFGTLKYSARHGLVAR